MLTGDAAHHDAAHKVVQATSCLTAKEGGVGGSVVGGVVASVRGGRGRSIQRSVEVVDHQLPLALGTRRHTHVRTHRSATPLAMKATQTYIASDKQQHG